MNGKKICVGFLLTVMVIASCQGQTGAIDRYLDSVVLASNIPAISAGIVVDGKVYWSGASGEIDIENNIAATPGSVFRIGSISKVLTATAILKLSEQDKIDLEAPVQDYLPDYPASKKGTITVRHLLSLTSGIRHYKGDENRSFVHYDDLRAACRVFENRKLKFSPGSGYHYSSYSFTVLGAIMESVTGKSYGEAMKELVFDLAGMELTGLDDRSDSSSNLALLYSKSGSHLCQMWKMI